MGSGDKLLSDAEKAQATPEQPLQIACGAIPSQQDDIWRDFAPEDRLEYERLAYRRRYVRLTFMGVFILFVVSGLIQRRRANTGQAHCVISYNREFGKHYRCDDSLSVFLSVVTFLILPVTMIALLCYGAWVEKDMDQIVRRTTGSTEKVASPSRPII